MILVDTSVWVDHLRQGEPDLVLLLLNAKVLVHPFVVGELALGNLHNRSSLLTFLQVQPQALVATDALVLQLIDARALHGRGIGYVDAHLLAATTLAPGSMLWTRDKKLRATASTLGIACSLC